MPQLQNFGAGAAAAGFQQQKVFVRNLITIAAELRFCGASSVSADHAAKN
jgi:hypothetical protein